METADRVKRRVRKRTDDNDAGQRGSPMRKRGNFTPMAAEQVQPADTTTPVGQQHRLQQVTGARAELQQTVPNNTLTFENPVTQILTTPQAPLFQTPANS